MNIVWWIAKTFFSSSCSASSPPFYTRTMHIPIYRFESEDRIQHRWPCCIYLKENVSTPSPFCILARRHHVKILRNLTRIFILYRDEKNSTKRTRREIYHSSMIKTINIGFCWVLTVEGGDGEINQIMRKNVLA